MTTDAIFEKYATALADLGADSRQLSGDAVLLALRLAIADAYAAAPVIATDFAAIVASQDKALQEALDQIDPLREERNALQAQLAQLDADNAGLTLRLHNLAGVQVEAQHMRQEIADLREQVIPDYQRSLVNLTSLLKERDRAILGLQAELDRLTRQNVIATDTVNSLSEAHANGVDPTAPPDWGRNHPAWEALPKADLSVIDQLSSGTMTFRRLDKSLRRDLVIRAIRYLASEHDGPLPSSAWDRNRPLWLPTQGAVNMLSDGQNWSSLLAMALAPA